MKRPNKTSGRSTPIRIHSPRSANVNATIAISGRPWARASSITTIASATDAWRIDLRSRRRDLSEALTNRTASLTLTESTASKGLAGYVDPIARGRRVSSKTGCDLQTVQEAWNVSDRCHDEDETDGGDRSQCDPR